MTAAAETDLLAGAPPEPAVSAAEVAVAVEASGVRVVVVDDDPTGTQAVSGVPVLMAWEVDDLRWALRQSRVLFVSANTRSLGPAGAAARVREIARAALEAARLEGVRFVVASRSDSTLRGHYPLETDVLAEELGGVDGVILSPAFVDSGRITVDSVHYARTADGFVPVGETEFARDRTFGYRASDLRLWVEEKTAGRVAAADVLRVTLDDLRNGGVEAVAAILEKARAGQPIAADAAGDGDLRTLALAIMQREQAGQVFLYRAGPSFVRARGGLEAAPVLDAARLRPILAGEGRHGLVAVGSHVAQTSRQVARLQALGGVTTVELDVPALIDPARRSRTLKDAIAAAVEGLVEADVVLQTSRVLLAGVDADASLAIARSVSDALVEAVRGIASAREPGWVVAKGGITSSDVVGRALGIRRAWVRGTLLPGIVSLWEPDAADPAPPAVVFPGNVGDDDALAAVVSTLREGSN